VDGMDLDFTRVKPWFESGQEQAGMVRMTNLVQQLRERTQKAGKTLSARFEYDPQSCIASRLDVEAWLSEGWLDQITLGGIGDHTPDAPSDWWVERAHAGGCKVFPGVEGQLHWIPRCGSGGTGIHPGDGVMDGYGPPSLEYMRAVAAVHYRSGADGIRLFNFTCADGCWNDVVRFDVPASALRSGQNTIELRRTKDNPGFEGAVEVRKCILELNYPDTFAPGSI